MQIEAYRDMITPVVDAFKYLTQVCTFSHLLGYFFSGIFLLILNKVSNL